MYLIYFNILYINIASLQFLVMNAKTILTNLTDDYRRIDTHERIISSAYAFLNWYFPYKQNLWGQDKPTWIRVYLIRPLNKVEMRHGSSSHANSQTNLYIKTTFINLPNMSTIEDMLTR
jgi:hypothetical protein